MRRLSNIISQMWGKTVKHNPPVILHEEDIFIVCYPRSGSTWTRFLLANLIRYGSGEPVDFYSVRRVIPDIERKAHWEMIRKMTSPRLIKCHYPYESKFKRAT